MKFTNLFSKKDSRIEALRAAVAANEKEAKWAFSFHRRRADSEKALADAKAAFFLQPSDAAAEDVLKIARELHSTSEGLYDLGTLAWQAEEPNQAPRLVAVIQPALDALIERLEEILKGIEKTDAEKAQTLAMEHEDVKSPVRERISAVIGEANDFKQAIAAGNMARLKPAVEFILTRGSDGNTPVVAKR
jgi:DNA-binding FadR family transcriptional regulator